MRHFVQKFSGEMDKQIEVISGDVMEELMRHSWPGNIRELENFVERAVILSQGVTLEAISSGPLPSRSRAQASARRASSLPLTT